MRPVRARARSGVRQMSCSMKRSSAAVRALLDQQAVAEARERRAHRAPAGAENLRELALRQLGARREAMVEHGVEDGVEHAIFGAAVAQAGARHDRAEAMRAQADCQQSAAIWLTICGRQAYAGRRMRSSVDFILNGERVSLRGEDPS